MYEFLIKVAVISFACRTLATMAIYAFSYGQFFGNVKLNLAKKANPELFNEFMEGVESVSQGDEESRKMYDMLCKDHFLIALLDCPFCIGFWISLVGGQIGYNMTNDIAAFILIPITTFYMIQRL